MFTPFFAIDDRHRLIDSFERQVERLLAPQRHDDGPRLSFADTGDELVLTADLPDVAEKDLEISIEGDVLTLRAEPSTRANPAAAEGFKLVRSERPRARLLRQIELPVRVDADAVRATFTDGVLELWLPKAKEARPRKITVNAALSKSVS